MRFGDRVEYFEELEKKGQRTPLRDLPSVCKEHEIVWETFEALNLRRPQALGPGPIPVNDIVAYVALRGVIDPESQLWFVDVIGRMDAAFLKEHADGRRGETTGRNRSERSGARSTASRPSDRKSRTRS